MIYNTFFNLKEDTAFENVKRFISPLCLHIFSDFVGLWKFAVDDNINTKSKRKTKLVLSTAIFGRT